MVTAAQLRTQQYQFQQDTTSGRWTWTTVVDVSGVSPAYRIENIVTPYGLLRDTVPLPGEIVEAMGDSIETLRTQFQPRILIGPPSTLTFNLDEGRGFSLPQEGLITNNGVFGSLLGTLLTSSAAYVQVSPTQVSNLASNETGSFEVTVDSSGLLALNSPYAATVTVTDPQATNTPQVLPITINVRPKAEISVSQDDLTFTVVKPVSGSFPTVPSQTFEIENTGPAGSVLEWQLQKVGCAAWLASFGPTSGSLASGETETITVVVAPPTSQSVGTFTETLRISGYSENTSVDVSLQLVVT